MEHLKSELDLLRGEIIAMYYLVEIQLDKAKQSFFNNKLNLSQEIAATEKLVNAKELQIDSRCESILALLTPVAVDLRFILSALKININLERIGDLADGIARTVTHTKGNFAPELLQAVNANRAFDLSLEMYAASSMAFEKEDTLLARAMFDKDEILDEVVEDAATAAEEYAKTNPDCLVQAINLLSIMKMLERIGDHVKNIAEEIIFYAEARVLKHAGSKQERENEGV
jgi:phosphate transport system protein